MVFLETSILIQRLLYEDRRKAQIEANLVGKEAITSQVCKKCGHRWFGLPVVREMEEKLSRRNSACQYALHSCLCTGCLLVQQDIIWRRLAVG